MAVSPGIGVFHGLVSLYGRSPVRQLAATGVGGVEPDVGAGGGGGGGGGGGEPGREVLGCGGVLGAGVAGGVPGAGALGGRVLAGGCEAERVVGGGGGAGGSGAGGALSAGWSAVPGDVGVASASSESSVPVEAGAAGSGVGPLSAASVAVAVGTSGPLRVDDGVGRGAAPALVRCERVVGALVGGAGAGDTEPIPPDPVEFVVPSPGRTVPVSGARPVGCSGNAAAAADAATEGWGVECSDCGSPRSDTTSVTAANPTPVTPSSGMKRLERPLRSTCTSVVVPGFARSGTVLPGASRHLN